MTFAEGVFWSAVFVVVVTGMPVPFVVSDLGWKAAIGTWALAAAASFIVGGGILLLAWGLSS